MKNKLINFGLVAFTLCVALSIITLASAKSTLADHAALGVAPDVFCRVATITPTEHAEAFARSIDPISTIIPERSALFFRRFRSTPIVYTLTGVNVNLAATDVATFTQLPPRYVIRFVTPNNASISLTAATYSLFSGAGGTGTAIVAAQPLSALTTQSAIVNSTIAASNARTEATLYVRVIAAQGAAATADFTLQIDPLP